MNINELEKLPATGFLRLPQVLKFIPISKTAWWSGIADGRYPKQVKLSKRVSAWRAEDIHDLIKRLCEGESDAD